MLALAPLNIRAHETFVDAADKANFFADYFSSVFTSEDVTHIPTLTTDPTPSMPPIRIQQYSQTQVFMIYYKTFNSIKLLDQTTFLHGS